jgi:hypothetical protein
VKKAAAVRWGEARHYLMEVWLVMAATFVIVWGTVSVLCALSFAAIALVAWGDIATPGAVVRCRR